MSPVGGRPFPVRPLVVAALLMVVLSGLSLDRADKLASIGGLFVALAGFLYTYRHGGAGPADPSAGSTPLPEGTRQRFGTALFHRYAGRLRGLVMGGPRIPLGAAIAATAAAGLVGVTITYLVGAPDAPPRSGGTGPSPSPSASVAAMPSGSAPPSDAADCPLPGGPATVTASTATVRRHARMKLPALYYADLDSTCPNWGITGDRDSSVHDVGNDGTGLFRASDTEIARVPRNVPATYEMCLANTDYLAATVGYDALKPGDRFCIKTIDRDSSRQSLLTIVALQRSGAARTLVLDVQTWTPTEPVQKDDNSLPILIGIILAVLILGGGTADATRRQKTRRERP